MDTIANNETITLKKNAANGADARKVGAAAAGAGAIVGGVAGAAIAGLNAEAANTQEETQETEQDQSQQHATQRHTSSHTPATSAQTPITENTETNVSETEGPDVQVEEQQEVAESTENAQGATIEEVQNVTPELPEEVNPDDIALAIVAGEEIDPNDINAADILDFAEVGTVYGADGTEYNGAYATDINGDEIVMVDVDGDNEYDVITDVEGNLLACGDTGVNTSDAELNLNENANYMAADPTNDMVAPESMMNDIITT